MSSKHLQKFDMHREIWLAFLLSVIGLAGVVSFYFVALRVESRKMAAETELQQLREKFELIDEVLTSSVLLAVTTGEARWIDRYDIYGAELEQVLRTFATKAPSAEARAVIAKISEHNDHLVAIEKRAFNLQKEGRVREAYDLILSGEYKKEKEEYAKGTHEIDQIVRQRIGLENRALTNAALFLAGLIMVMLVLAIIRWRSALILVASTHRFMDNLIEHLPVAVFCKDYRDDLRFVLWNKKSEEMAGFSRHDVLGRRDDDLFSADDAARFRERDIKVLESGGQLNVPMEVLSTAPGRVFYRKTVKVSIPGDDGKPRYLLGVSEDVTELKKAEDEVAQQRAEALARGKLVALGEMAGGIAHEINNPLGIINGYATCLREEADAGEMSPEEFRFYAQKTVRKIEKTCARIGSIIKSLRVIARDGEHDPFEVVGLEEVVRDSISLLQEKAKNHGIELTLAPYDEHLEVRCRSVQISQILVNLLNNAFDAVVHCNQKRINVVITKGMDTVDIRVIDTGPGVPPGVREKIFHPFFTTKDVGKGTGIGLSISRSIAEEHGGTLYLDESRKETCFTLSLPLASKAGAGAGDYAATGS